MTIIIFDMTISVYGADSDKSEQYPANELEKKIEFYKSVGLDDTANSIDRLIVLLRNFQEKNEGDIEVFSDVLSKYAKDVDHNSPIPNVMRAISSEILSRLDEPKKSMLTNKLFLLIDYRIDVKTIPPGITYSTAYLYPVLQAVYEISVDNITIIAHINDIENIKNQTSRLKALVWLFAKNNGIVKAIEMVSNSQSDNHVNIKRNETKEQVLKILKSVVGANIDRILNFRQ